MSGGWWYFPVARSRSWWRRTRSPLQRFQDSRIQFSSIRGNCKILPWGLSACNNLKTLFVNLFTISKLKKNKKQLNLCRSIATRTPLGAAPVNHTVANVVKRKILLWTTPPGWAYPARAQVAAPRSRLKRTKKNWWWKCSGLVWLDVTYWNGLRDSADYNYRSTHAAMRSQKLTSPSNSSWKFASPASNITV